MHIGSEFGAGEIVCWTFVAVKGLDEDGCIGSVTAGDARVEGKD